MIKFLLPLTLLSSIAFAQNTFMTRSIAPLKFMKKNGKLWCSNGNVSFRFLIEDTDLRERYPRIEIKSLWIMNDKTGEVKAYLPYKPASTFLADSSYIIKGGKAEGEFPAVFMESYPRYQPTEQSILYNFESGNIASKKVYLNFSQTDYSVHHTQNFFEGKRGNRLMVVCGSWNFEKNYAYDPNPFN